MTVPVRLAGPGDPCLPELAHIEDAGEVLFADHLDTSGWAPAPSGSERAEQPGFVLVAGDPVVGFAHVRDLDGRAHLDQLSVHPDHGRRGIGQALVRAVMYECARRGFESITLCTFAAIPWNGPFYARLGFREIEEAAAPEPVRELRRHEREVGLDRGGRRMIMRAVVATAPVTPRPAVSVIPVRDGPEGLEVFVQHRQSTMDFAAGAVVFPGGRCDPGTRRRERPCPCPRRSRSSTCTGGVASGAKGATPACGPARCWPPGCGSSPRRPGCAPTPRRWCPGTAG